MKIAVVGSREYFPLSDVADYINSLPLDVTIVSGGAKGVDDMAERAARKRGMTVISFPANWKELGVGAGMIRNKTIVKEADLVVAFWDLKSKGTAHTITLAAEAKKLHRVNISNFRAAYIATKLRGGQPIEPQLQ